jgi:biopolymer transport protein ExbD
MAIRLGHGTDEVHDINITLVIDVMLVRARIRYAGI